MDDSTAKELNALEQAVATDPVNLLNSEPDPRKWTLSTMDIARTATVDPIAMFSTKEELEGPEKWSWVKTAWKGLIGMSDSITQALDTSEDAETYKLRNPEYRSPNMSQEDAERLIEDVARTSVFISQARQRDVIKHLNPTTADIYAISNGIGNVITFALTSYTTKSPAATSILAGTLGKQELTQEQIEKYVTETGSAKGITKTLEENNDIANAYGVFMAATEATIGVDKIASGSLNRYARLEAMARKARMEGKYGKALAIRTGREFGITAAEEYGEEFVQSLGETAALEGWQALEKSETYKKAKNDAVFGAIIGGPAGMIFYNIGRKGLINNIEAINTINNLGMTESQIVQVADEIIQDETHYMLDEITTRAEIKGQYGQAYELIKARIKETIENTGTTPWADTGDSSAFDEAWANHEVDKGGTTLKFNDKYGTVITITPVIAGKNKGKFQVRAIDRNGRFDMLTENGTWGNLGQKDENGVAIPWSTKGFDSVQDAYNALKEIYSQPSAESRQAKIDEFVETNAKALTVPLIMAANVYGMPLSDFIEVADMQVVKDQPILMFAPISNIDDVRALLDKQKAIIKEQNTAKKLGIQDDVKLERAQRRKATLEILLKEMEQQEKINKAVSTRKKQKVDYVTAQQLMPTQTTTIDTAVQAKEGQDYVMFAGKRIPVEYQVVELADIQPSHINGEPNPNYTNTELQNRASRGTTQDVADLRGKALPENFTPERLLKAPTSAEGAPVVNAQGEVIAGNGRAEIVRYAYESPESAEKYKTALQKSGYNIDGMNQPILVRRNTTMTPEEQVAAADLSNISETSAFDEASQARMDSKYIKDSKTPLDFAAKLPMSDRRGLMNNDGTWNQRRVKQRYESALLSWLLGNDTKLFENLVLNGRLPQKVIDILVANGSQIYALNEKYPDANIRADIYYALHKMQYASKSNFVEITQQIEMDPRDVMPENVILWSWLFADTNMAQMLLDNYITILEQNHDTVNQGADMFGEKVPPLSKKDALMQALKKTDEAKAQLAAQRKKENYEPLFDQETGEVKNAELASAIASYQNQFAPRPESDQELLNKTAYTSGPVFFNRPSTEYVLKGGEGQIVHGWGIYAMLDRLLNKQRYREGRYAGKYVYVPGMPKIQQLIKGAKNQKESQIFKLVLDTIAGRTPINMYKPIGFAGGISSYVPIFYLDALYEVMGKDANPVDKAFLEKIIEKGQFADETIFKVDPKMSKWLQRAIVETLDMHNDLKNSQFYKKDLPYIFVNALTLSEVQNDFIDFVKKDFKHKDLNANANKELSKRIVEYIQNGGRIEYEPFDNAIFQESGAQVIDLDRSYRAYDVIQMLKQTLDGTTGNFIGQAELQQYLDRGILEDPQTYGGFISLVALAKRSTSIYVSSLFAYGIASGKTTLDDIDTNNDFKVLEQHKDTDNATKFWVSIIESAKKIYNKDKPKDPFEVEIKTWEALSKAFKNLTKEQNKLLTQIINEIYDVPLKDVPLVIQALQNPQYIKQTRGQQLEVNVPEDDQLLNEETFLAEQPSAPLLRKVLEEFTPGGLLYDYVNRTNERNFKAYREKHNIPEQNLKDFHERLFENIMSGLIDGYTPEEIGRNKEVKLLIDYVMENLKGDDFYIATMEAIQDTSIDLESGETIGETKDYSEFPNKNVMGIQVSSELARDASLYLNDMGIKGVTYRGGVDKTGFVIFSDDAIQMLQRIDDDMPIYYKKKGVLQGQYDPELQTLLLTKYWDELTLVHEMHHRYLLKLFEKFKSAQAGRTTVTPAFQEDISKLFSSLGITPDQTELTTVQQEKFAYMVEAYLTGYGVENPDNLAFQGFLHWIPEKVKSIYDLGYLDEQGNMQNPMLDQDTIDFFNRWFASPIVPSLPTAPDAQRLVNITDENGEIIPSNQKVMNNREKEWGQDSEIQNKADAQLWQAIGENNPSDVRAGLDGQAEINKAEADNAQDDRILPEKPKLRDKWFKTHQPNARELAAEAARAYLAKNPEHARELAFADPETMAEYDAPVDHGMLIRAVMETVQKGSDEWYILDDNLATVKSMAGQALSLPGDTSHQAYLDAKREIEAARELKAAVNYAGTHKGAMDKWNSDIRAFAARRTEEILKTAPGSKEREVAIKAFLEEAKTKFSGNTTNAILNKMDYTGYNTTNKGVFVKWAEKQIKEVSHAFIDTKESAELMKASIAAQIALRDIDSTEVKDGNYIKAIRASKDLRHWQFVKDKIKKANIGRWGRFGIFFDNLFGSYAPSAMLMSFNTLFFANVPSTALNNTIVSRAARVIGENKVDKNVTKGEEKRIKQIFNASGMNLAQMEKPTSPSLLHGEKYTNEGQKHWYNFTFDILGREDNWFRIPTFVDALARLATRNANGDPKKATELFKQYARLNNQSDEAKIARKEALAVANMAVFTQDGILATQLGKIRSAINVIFRGILGLQPNGFGLGNILSPFLKTGANVIEMGLSSTLAPVRTVFKGFKRLQGKPLTDMDKIALRTDWTYFALAAVGVAVLAAISGDDDDWYEEPYEPGRPYDPNKPYDSIRIGNVWIKLDIFGPLEVPLRTAAMLVKDWDKRKMASIANGMWEALGEVPLLNQVTDTNMDYMVKNTEKWGQTFLYNQLNKLVPAQAKSLSRAGTRAAGIEADVSAIGPVLERKFHRNYGLDGIQVTTNDLINILTNRLKFTPK